MNARSAWIWASIAIGLFAAIFAYERFFFQPPQGPQLLFPSFKAAGVQSIQVLSSDGAEIQVQRTNGTWRLTRPLSYPAQTNSIEVLLKTLEGLVPATTLSTAALSGNPEWRSEFGLEEPRLSLVFTNGQIRQQLLIGSTTSPGDQIFVQVAGEEQVHVVDVELLKLIPGSDKFWRDTRLFDLPSSAYSRITVTSGEQVVELRHEPTGRGWSIVRPMQARADAAHLGELLQGLNDLQVRRFITDDPSADLEAYGLLPTELEIAFFQGSNSVQSLRFGKSLEDGSGLLYAIGREPESVVGFSSDSLLGWRITPNDFRDRQLIRIPNAVVAMEIENGESFSLRQTTNGVWTVEPLGLPADTATIQRFIEVLAGLRVVQFVKDVVAESDLPTYGLAEPKLRIRLELKATSTNEPAPVVELALGDVKDDQIMVRRADENAVYAVEIEPLAALPVAAGHFRDHRVWEFDENEVKSLTVQKGEQVWELLRNGQNKWTLAPGSQGIVNAFGIEETLHHLSQLSAVVWTDWGELDVSSYGLDEEPLSLTVELRDNSRRTVRLGALAPSSHIYAGITIEGEEWVFEFPTETFAFVEVFLIKPSNLL